MVNRIVLTSLLLLLVPLWATGSTVTLPKTGQTLCYDANGAIDCAGTGQDGETQIGATWPTPRFTDNLNGTVTDNLTGLIWLQDALCTALNPPPANPSLSLQGGRDWASAITAANSLMSGQCGLRDGSVAGNWRLPNVNEMESLIDISQSNPPLPANNHFINVPQTLPIYWTSTITGDYFPGINAIGAVLFTGKIQGDVKTSPKYIWPVRGDSTTLARTGQNTCWDPNDSSASGTVVACNGSGTDGALQKGVPLPSPRFFDNVNGTITDSLTGLIWPRNAGCFSNISSQGQALTLAKTLAHGTCDLIDGSAPGDWRLPNRKEMRSLVDYGGTWLAEFTGSPPHGWYWTSDSYAVPPDTSQKWVVKSQGLDWLNTELLTYQQLPPYFMLPVRGALKIQRITFGPATITYGDPPFDLSAITTGGGSGNPVTFTLVSGPATLSGTRLTATGGGNVVVKASQSGSATFYPAADTLHTFSVGNLSGTVTITLAGLSQTYDGTPKLVTATTSPAGMAVTFSYAGSATPPTNAGSYPVVATIDDPIHHESTSGILVVGKATGTVTLGNLGQTYNGTPRSATATTIPAGGTVILSYPGSSGAPTNAGSYPVVATIADSNFQTSTNSGTMIIAKATGTITLGSLSQTYDGTAKAATATTSPAGGNVTFTYAGSSSAPINAGSYDVSATINDSNFEISSATGNLVIAKAPATVTLTPSSLSQTYTGTALSAAVTTTPAGKTVTVNITYNGSTSAPTNAGTYPVVATISDANYQGSAVTDNLVVAKGAATVTLGSLSQVYDGTAKSATATTLPDGKTVTFSYTPANPIDAGSYAVVGTVSDANYAGTASGSLTVTKRTPTVTWSTPAPIASGTALSAVQLNATGSVPGSFVYAPAAGAVPPSGSQTLSATFTPTDTTNYTTASASVLLAVAPTFTVTFASGSNGSLTGTTSQTVASGASTSAVTAVPATGFHFVQWTGPGSFTSASNPLTVANVTANQTLTANFAVSTFLVTSSAPGGNGSISCTSPVNYGANCICTMTPNAGYHVFTLTDNNADQMAAVSGSTFTITGVTGNHVVSATFARPNGILNPVAGKTLPDIGDALAVLKMVLKITTCTAADIARADIAPLGPDGKPLGDGKLDLYDVIGILRMSIGL